MHCPVSQFRNLPKYKAWSSVCRVLVAAVCCLSCTLNFAIAQPCQPGETKSFIHPASASTGRPIAANPLDFSERKRDLSSAARRVVKVNVRTVSSGEQPAVQLVLPIDLTQVNTERLNAPRTAENETQIDLHASRPLTGLDGLALPGVPRGIEPFVAPSETDGHTWDEIATVPVREGPPQPASPRVNSTVTSDAWWLHAATEQIRNSSKPVHLDLDQLFVLTAAFSGRVQAVAQTPWVNRTLVQQAFGAFDPVFYTDARFDSISDPVENSLTTGGPPRLEDDIVGIDAGLRGQTRFGTAYNVGQRFGHKNSNSTFFVPNNQGSSRLYANVTQPLMRGRKIDVNRSLVLTARFETQAALATYRSALQKQLFDVADVYWSLYFERAALLQRLRHIDAAKAILTQLEGRIAHDSTQNQILRAKAAVASRSAEIVDADAQIRNLESRMRALVNAPAFVVDRDAELIPNRIASTTQLDFDLEQEVSTALCTRPEIAELTAKVRAAKARIELAKDMTKPQLDFVGESYLAGLEGESNLFGAWADQFTEGRPGFAAGLLYQRPVNNEISRATVNQRWFELNQLQHLITEARENIRAEVESAVRNTIAAGEAAEARRKSLEFVTREVAYLEDRWMNLGADARLGQIQLDELLRAQNRLLLEQQNLLRTSVQFHRSLLELQRATGALITFVD
ncbi:MAG TPA: hypothetical protein DDW52_18530 [Planctomycetaceae bacterium]|nr:hypothetical protein [Planctomycetaceae bacterium]